MRLIVKTVSREQKPNPPKLFMTNPQSLTNIYEEFHEIILNIKPDIIVVSKTWFSINKPVHLFEVDNYQMFHKDRLARVAGGVALFIHSSIFAKPLNIIVPENLECI